MLTRARCLLVAFSSSGCALALHAQAKAAHGSREVASTSGELGGGAAIGLGAGGTRAVLLGAEIAGTATSEGVGVVGRGGLDVLLHTPSELGLRVGGRWGIGYEGGVGGGMRAGGEITLLLPPWSRRYVGPSGSEKGGRDPFLVGSTRRSQLGLALSYEVVLPYDDAARADHRAVVGLSWQFSDTPGFTKPRPNPSPHHEPRDVAITLAAHDFDETIAASPARVLATIVANVHPSDGSLLHVASPSQVIYADRLEYVATRSFEIPMQVTLRIEPAGDERTRVRGTLRLRQDVPAPTDPRAPAEAPRLASLAQRKLLETIRGAVASPPPPPRTTIFVLSRALDGRLDSAVIRAADALSARTGTCKLHPATRAPGSDGAVVEVEPGPASLGNVTSVMMEPTSTAALDALLSDGWGLVTARVNYGLGFPCGVAIAVRLDDLGRLDGTTAMPGTVRDAYVAARGRARPLLDNDDARQAARAADAARALASSPGTLDATVFDSLDATWLADPGVVRFWFTRRHEAVVRGAPEGSRVDAHVVIDVRLDNAAPAPTLVESSTTESTFRRPYQVFKP